MRLADGTRVSRFELAWRGDFPTAQSVLELEHSREFADLDAAPDALLASHRRGRAPSFAGHPFERRRLLDELLPAAIRADRAHAGLPACRFEPSGYRTRRAAASPRPRRVRRR